MSIFGPRQKAAALIVKKSFGYGAHSIFECTCMLYKSIEPLVNELEPGQTLCDRQKHRQTRTQTHRYTDTQTDYYNLPPTLGLIIIIING